MDGSRTPAIAFSMVDLPLPFVPTRPTVSPLSMLNETSFSAWNSLKNSSCRSALMKYSFRLPRFSDAMLNVIVT